jgi:glyoxylase-like metal-dependent hydrolase (beta-lactamase superfamily II)
MRKLNRELYWLQGLGGIINAYVWNGDTLLDTAGPLVAHALFREAKRGGFPKENFRHVLLSHCHVDHAGGLMHVGHAVNVYGAACDLDVLLGKLTPPRYHPKFGFLVEAAERLVPAFRFGDHHRPTAVADGAAAQGWQAIEIPGHTPGSVCWYQPETRTLFTGDVLVNHFGFLTGPAPLFSEDYPLAIRSLQRLRELELETVIFGHGIPLINDAERRTHRLIDRLVEKLEREGAPAFWKVR